MPILPHTATIFNTVSPQPGLYLSCLANSWLFFKIRFGCPLSVAPLHPYSPSGNSFSPPLNLYTQFKNFTHHTFLCYTCISILSHIPEGRNQVSFISVALACITAPSILPISKNLRNLIYFNKVTV